MITCLLLSNPVINSELDLNSNVVRKQLVTQEELGKTVFWRLLLPSVHTPYILLQNKIGKLELGQFALERFTDVAEQSGAGMLYSDHYAVKEGEKQAHPCIDYQLGSIRDDFNFGSILFFKTSALKDALNQQKTNCNFAALYQLRLTLSQEHGIARIPEFLYTDAVEDTRKFGVKIFDYLDPENKQVQQEMEHCCTEHLKAMGAFLPAVTRTVSFDEDFDVEASVIIPVKDRARTIADAIHSALIQKTNFRFNILIVNNGSKDGTNTIIEDFAKKDERIIHIIPQRKDLGIGGCWNEAIFHSQCGKFAVQLDSDDMYSDENTLQKIIGKFYETSAAMVIGSYTIVNFNGDEIPPGLIDHREWTDHNGFNNALRINGLGAPRAFYTPVIRNVKFPNVSYAEDYMVGLAITRQFKIARIYESHYLCRRWEDNTDAGFTIEKANFYNVYKDRLRTFEIMKRQQYQSKI